MVASIVLCGVASAQVVLDGRAIAERNAELDQWLRVVRTEDRAGAAGGAIRQAETALESAKQSKDGIPAAARAQAIAEAALTLADRRVARYAAAQSLADGQARLQIVKERAEAQRRVLEALMRERASLALAAEEAR